MKDIWYLVYDGSDLYWETPSFRDAVEFMLKIKGYIIIHEGEY